MRCSLAWLHRSVLAWVLVSFASPVIAQTAERCWLVGDFWLNRPLETFVYGSLLQYPETGADTPDELWMPEVRKPWSETTIRPDGTTVIRRMWLTHENGPFTGTHNNKVYSSTYFATHVEVNTCDSGGCQKTNIDGSITREDDGRWLFANALVDCIAPLEATVQVDLTGSRRSIDKPAEDPLVDMVAKVTIGGFPYTYGEVNLKVSADPAGKSPGSLCKNGFCSVSTWRTDENGDIRFQYKTWAQEGSQTDTIEATCVECTNTAAWNIKIGQPDIVIGFFNGVANTEDAAQDSLKRLEKEFGPQYKDSPLEYDWFYNQTACGDSALGKVSCLEDVAEVFEQRSRELNSVFANRWESFWDILAGRQQQDTSFTGRLISLLGEGGKALFLWVDGTASAILNQLASSFLKLLTLFIDSPTYENQASHLERLTSYADEGSRFLLVAHSQGNLFVNSAFDALKAARPETQAQVVHVAPASPTLRGDYVLSDVDLVINALRITGPNSVPNVNINLPLSKTDPSGHSFEPSYLDKARAAYARTIGMITTGLEALAQ